MLVECRWCLFQSLVVSFDQFDIEAEPACDWDSLEITFPGNERTRKLCGNTIPNPVVINAIGVIIFKFQSDGVYGYKGFRANYRIDVGTYGGVGAQQDGKQ